MKEQFEPCLGALEALGGSSGRRVPFLLGTSTSLVSSNSWKKQEDKWLSYPPLLKKEEKTAPHLEEVYKLILPIKFQRDKMLL